MLRTVFNFVLWMLCGLAFIIFAFIPILTVEAVFNHFFGYLFCSAFCCVFGFISFELCDFYKNKTFEIYDQFKHNQSLKSQARSSQTRFSKTNGINF